MIISEPQNSYKKMEKEIEIDLSTIYNAFPTTPIDVVNEAISRVVGKEMVNKEQFDRAANQRFFALVHALDTVWLYGRHSFNPDLTRSFEEIRTYLLGMYGDSINPSLKKREFIKQVRELGITFDYDNQGVQMAIYHQGKEATDFVNGHLAEIQQISFHEWLELF